jgi:hypothetical protein
MKPVRLAILATCLGCQSASATPPAPAAAFDAATLLGAPITFKNLTLIPLIAKKVDDTDYLALDEGMDKGLVKVSEKQHGGSVNEVTLENRSDRALFLMAGEVILGGKQDRVIGKDTIVPPKQKTDIPVFCVEHGRWTGEEQAQFHSGKSLAHSKLRSKAKYESQGKVWQEVSEKNAKRATANSTDTYRQVATGGSVDKAVQPYADHFKAALVKSPDAAKVVGYVMVLNGQIVGLERFGSPRLMAKYRDKLLRSYYVEAVDAPTVAVKALPTAADVKAFAAKAEVARSQKVVENANSTTEDADGDGVKATKVRDKARPAAAPPAYQSISAD